MNELPSPSPLPVADHILQDVFDDDTESISTESYIDSDDDEYDDDESDDDEERVTSMGCIVSGYKPLRTAATTMHLDGGDVLDAVNRSRTHAILMKRAYDLLDESRWLVKRSRAQLHGVLNTLPYDVVDVTAAFLDNRDRRALVALRRQDLTGELAFAAPPRPAGVAEALDTWFRTHRFHPRPFYIQICINEVTKILVAMAAVDWFPHMNVDYKMQIAITYVLVDLGPYQARYFAPELYYRHAMWITYVRRTLMKVEGMSAAFKALLSRALGA